MKLRYTGKTDEVKNVCSFKFEPAETVSWQPGQYMHYVLDLPKVDDKGPERWFTISSAPFEKQITITTRLDNMPFSAFKQYLLDLKPGDEIQSDGPGGKFILRDGQHRHILIAGGIGITPYRSMLAQLAHDHKPANAVLLYANRDNDFVFDAELAGYAAADQTLQIKKFVDKRITAEDLQDYVADSSAVFYLSGPKAMVESYEHLLPELGVSTDNIMKDYFPGY